MVNGEKLNCEKSTTTKFCNLFQSKRDQLLKGNKSEEEKNIKDKLKAKYNK